MFRYSLVCVLLTMVSYLSYIKADPSIDSQPSCRTGKLDLVVVVDVSSSVQRRFVANRDAAFELARPLPISWEFGAVVSVIQYSRTAFVKLEFTKDQTLPVINESIATMEWTGGVAVSADAMDLAMVEFRQGRSDAERVIVLFSDGNTMNSWQEVQATAERLKYSNARIFAVTMFGKPNQADLTAFIGNSNGSIITNQTGLIDLEKELLDMTVRSCPPSQNIPDAKPGESAGAPPTEVKTAEGTALKTGEGPVAPAGTGDNPDMKPGQVQNHLKHSEVDSSGEQTNTTQITTTNSIPVTNATTV